MEAISDLPMLHDIDADYSPQYVKLARILRDKITSGALKCPDPLPAADLAAEYRVSARIAYAALEMLEANRYVARPKRFQSYRVAWQAGAVASGLQGGGAGPGDPCAVHEVASPPLIDSPISQAARNAARQGPPAGCRKAG